MSVSPAGDEAVGRSHRPATDTTERRLADVVAEQVLQEISARRLAPGASVGSEAELLARYSVSRSVFREAVRVLEHLGAVRMRRGRGGGLFVTTPDTSAVITAVEVFLTYARVPLDDVLAARVPLEAASARLAAERAGDDVRAAFGAYRHEVSDGDDETPFHTLIGRAAANPALELFVDIVTAIPAHYRVETRAGVTRLRAARRAAATAHERIGAAIVAGDGAAAGRRMTTHLSAMRTVLSHRDLERTLGLDASNGRTAREEPLAADLARRIYTEVVARGWPVGSPIGTESELVARYRVSRRVVREALRLLEFNGVVTTRRGSTGGAFVDEPSVAATVEAMATYLEWRGITPLHLYEVRHALELAAVDLAVSVGDAESGDRLRSAAVIDDVRHLRVRANEFHLCIAQLTGNRVLELFLTALTRLADRHTAASVSARLTADLAVRAEQAHAAIAGAIASGDAALARRRMEHHLVGLMPYQE